MKLNDEKNMKHADIYCNICKTSELTLLDEFHGETFCAGCGQVLHNNTRKSVVEQIKEAKIKEKEFAEYLKTKLFE